MLDGSYQDTNECLTDSPCSEADHTTCQNTEGGYACVCVVGFAFNDVTGICEGMWFYVLLLLTLSPDFVQIFFPSQSLFNYTHFVPSTLPIISNYST